MSLRNKVKIKRLLPALLVGIFIFCLGIGVGNGRLEFGVNSIFHKSLNKNLPANLNYSSVEELYDALRSSYDGNLDQTKLLDGIKQGLAEASGDPYTEYLNATDAKKFDEDISGTFEGIGAQLGKNDNKYIVIIAPIAGTPADKAGLRAKDVIAEIDGKSAFNLGVEEAKNKIRGPKGSHVKLKIVRDEKAIDVDIVRDTIVVPSVITKIMDGNIGYMQITQFGPDTSRLALEAAKSFKEAKVAGVVLDLRDDPGGLLDSAVDISGIWLNNKVVLKEKRGGQVVQTYRSDNNAILGGIPTVVLINDGSASASEIVAGALKDNKAATLLGTKSFGKGSVQNLDHLPGGGVLKVTIARWYTPDDKNIDKTGIVPDQIVDKSEDDIKNNRDPQLESALQFLKK